MLMPCGCCEGRVMHSPCRLFCACFFAEGGTKKRKTGALPKPLYGLGEGCFNQILNAGGYFQGLRFATIEKSNNQEMKFQIYTSRREVLCIKICKKRGDIRNLRYET